MEALAIALAINFLPAIIAAAREHYNGLAIFISIILIDALAFTGIITGVTLVLAGILWFICLIWSLTGNTRKRDERLARMIRGEK